MTSVLQLRFRLLECIDWCIHKQSEARRSHNSFIRSTFKDSKRRPKAFVYFNFVLWLIHPIFFFIVKGFNKRTKPYAYWIFMTGLLLELISGVVLIFVYKYKNSLGCKAWCAFEAALLLFFLLLTLTQLVSVTWTALILLLFTAFVKFYGLSVIYYFSLELEDSFGVMNTPKMNVRHSHNGDNEMAVKYFGKNKNGSTPSLNSDLAVVLSKKKEIVRRQTDQTSIASSGSHSSRSGSKTNHDEDDNDETDDDAFLMASVSNQNINEIRSSFHLGEPQYSDIMMSHSPITLPYPVSNSLPSVILDVPSNEPENVTIDKENDNIVISKLMCGGMSAINPSEVEV